MGDLVRTRPRMLGALQRDDWVADAHGVAVLDLGIS